MEGKSRSSGTGELVALLRHGQANSKRRRARCCSPATPFLETVKHAYHFVMFHLELAFAGPEELWVDALPFVMESLPPDCELTMQERRQLAKSVAKHITASISSFYERQQAYSVNWHRKQLVLVQENMDWLRSASSMHLEELMAIMEVRKQQRQQQRQQSLAHHDAVSHLLQAAIDSADPHPSQPPQQRQAQQPPMQQQRLWQMQQPQQWQGLQGQEGEIQPAEPEDGNGLRALLQHLSNSSGSSRSDAAPTRSDPGDADASCCAAAPTHSMHASGHPAAVHGTAMHTAPNGVPCASLPSSWNSSALASPFAAAAAGTIQPEPQLPSISHTTSTGPTSNISNASSACSIGGSSADGAVSSTAGGDGPVSGVTTGTVSPGTPAQLGAAQAPDTLLVMERYFSSSRPATKDSVLSEPVSESAAAGACLPLNAATAAITANPATAMPGHAPQISSALTSESATSFPSPMWQPRPHSWDGDDVAPAKDVFVKSSVIDCKTALTRKVPTAVEGDAEPSQHVNLKLGRSFAHTAGKSAAGSLQPGNSSGSSAGMPVTPRMGGQLDT